MAADTPASRMDALCRFIERWLGPRQPDFGETPDALAKVALPMPLLRLYEFAGRWPNRDGEVYLNYAVPAFAHQDTLLALDRLKTEGGKVVFLYENQGNWKCRTLPAGEDPPVWCEGELWDEKGESLSGELQVCGSLSRFLVSFVLQELALASRMHVLDRGLTERFRAAKAEATPLWLNGQYVHGTSYNFYLWEGVLVAELGGFCVFAANDPGGVDFLQRNQGPVGMICLAAGEPWRLDIRPDGSGEVRFVRGYFVKKAGFPPGTFDFPSLLKLLEEKVSDQGDYRTNGQVFFFREGQSGSYGKHLHDHEFVRSLFETAVGRGRPDRQELADLLDAEWPLPSTG